MWIALNARFAAKSSEVLNVHVNGIRNYSRFPNEPLSKVLKWLLVACLSSKAPSFITGNFKTQG